MAKIKLLKQQIGSPLRFVSRLLLSAAFLGWLGLALPVGAEAAGKETAAVQDASADELFERANALFLRGDGPRGLPLLIQAARKGHVESMFALGTAFYVGIGTSRDLVAAREWYQQAAALGHGGAMMGLGILGEVGVAGFRDRVTAYCWYSRALDPSARPPEPEAREFRKTLAADMTADELLCAQGECGDIARQTQDPIE